MKIEKLILQNQILIMKGLIAIGEPDVIEEMKEQIKRIEHELKMMSYIKI